MEPRRWRLSHRRLSKITELGNEPPPDHIGIILVAAGLLWPLIQKAGLGRLPGDLAFGGENFRVYIPITTSILISIVLSFVLWLINR